MAGKRAKVSERELARRRAAAERIDKGVEEIRKQIQKTGPPKETIVETLRRFRGWPSKDGSP